MNVDQYLQRIGITIRKHANLETLSELQLQHMLHIPFENLDVIRHIPIRLNVASFYYKVVVNHRGGFCYELNGLFNWLLQSLRFHSRLVSATVHLSDGSWALQGSHACLIVELDEPYLVDVGFGDSIRIPLPLTGEIRKDISGTYRIEKVKENLYDLQRLQAKDNQWITLIRVNTKKRDLMDFEKGCHFNQTSPYSHFTQKDIVSIATFEGRTTLSDHSLTITHNGNKKSTIITENEKLSTLKEYFHIQLN